MTETVAPTTGSFAPPSDLAGVGELALRAATLARLVDANIVGIATCDADGRILEANDAYLDLLGYSREDLASGRLRWQNLTPPEWQAASRRAVAEIEATGRCSLFEKEYFRKDGSRVPVLLASAAIDEAKSRIVGFVLDLSDRKRAEEERDRARQLVEEREMAIANERTRLAGEIHDTLAQALAMIVMQLADAESKLGPAWSQAEKPLSIVRDLAVESLAYARRSVSMLRPSGAAGLSRSIRDVVDSVRRLFAGSLMLDVSGDAVGVDPGIESAFLGIAREALTNAIKHSQATRITVELNIAPESVRLVVSDDGIGFDANAVRADAYGLVSMQERAAAARIALTFVTEPAAGTTIIASWSPAPFPEAAAR